MIILLSGVDSYRRQKKIKEIVEEYYRKHPYYISDRFDFSNLENGDINDEFSRLKEFAVNRSLFDNMKLAILENVWGKNIKTIQKDFKKFLKESFFLKDFIVIISDEKNPPSDFSIFDKKSEFLIKQDFSELEKEKMEFFIEKEIKEKGIKLSPQAIEFLAKAFSGDTWSLATELEKLTLVNDNKIIDLNKLKELGDYYEAQNIFSFINSFERGGFNDWRRRFIYLEELLFSRGEPAKIFNILASRSRLSPDLIEKLADYDVMVKSGKIDYEEVLIDLILSMSS